MPDTKRIKKRVQDTAAATLEKTGEAAQKTAETVKEGASVVGEKVSEVASKGMEALKTGAKKVSHFTGEASKLAKLKVEIHNLKSARDRLFLEAGTKLWHLRQGKKLADVQTAFSEEFQRMAELQAQIMVKEKEAESISLTE